MLTKSDFLLYLDAPLHLWAQSHDLLHVTPSTYDQHLMKQGYAVEKVAKEYLTKYILPKYTHAELLWQPTYKSGEYEARADGLIHDLDSDTYDLYEIKSSTKTKKDHLPDATFQSIVIGENVTIGTVNLVLLNDKYIRGDEIDIEQLFSVPNVTDEVREMTGDIEAKMRDALSVIKSDNHDKILNCLKPNTCPCPELCHPNLPHPSIYNIPNLSIKKRRELEDQQILSLSDLPLDYPLTPNQQKHVDVMLSNTPHLDKPAVAGMLQSLLYPLYFLDYETYDEAMPLYKGHKPYQKMVFQYSLHVLESEGAEYIHHEHLAMTTGDPALDTVKAMREVIGDVGSVIVWNKTFEGGRNKEMAAMFSEYSEFLLDVNKRIFDLMEVVSKGYYLHPDFGGRYTIKKVLPVMVPELTYNGLTINKGDQAMTAWWEMVNMEGKNLGVKKQAIAGALLQYCELDTFAMVRIWEELKKLIV
jgi:hypothetical protein